MGVKKMSNSETKNDENEETEVGLQRKDLQESITLEAPNNTGSPKGRITELRALLLSIEFPLSQWPGEALKAIVRRFRRMPRTGWLVFREIYNNKFTKNISIEEMKKLSKHAIGKNNGVKCTRTKYMEESSKSIKSIDKVLEEKTLQEAKLRSKVREQLSKEFAWILEKEVDKVEWTRKVSSEKIDNDILNIINQELDLNMTENHPSNWCGIAHALQVAQHCYQSMTTTNRKKSTWKESIEKKIEKSESAVRLLKKVKIHEKLTDEENRIGRKTMRELNLVLQRNDDVEIAINTLNQRAVVYQAKLDSYTRRKEFQRDNRCFELYRGKFYRELKEKKVIEHQVKKEEVCEFWNTMWNKSEDKKEDYKEYLYDFIPPKSNKETVFPSYAEFINIIKWLPSWKAAGCDGIYNFFIKKCTSIHPHLYKVIKETCMKGLEIKQWFYSGITYLIPKEDPKKGSDFRPITCMSNLYKLTTKCVTKVMQEMVENRGLLAENQLGTVRRVQGAKEQAMINIALNKANNNMLRTAWIDVKKAFDSVNHSYLMSCVKRLNLPDWISEFLENTIKNWSLSIRFQNEEVLRKEVKRGILQGDSLSPLLFVLCMDPLSRKLNMKYPKVEIKLKEEVYTCNHLLFIDDLKIYAETDEALKKMMSETENFFNKVGLEMNKAKSATNSEMCEEKAVVLSASEGYKYLGITENRESKVTRETYENLRKTIVDRVESLCKTRLSGKNSVKAINEYALSVVNYYVGVVPLDPKDYQLIDEDVRKVLTKHKIHLKPACKERLYLPRNEIGRGLLNIVHKSERMQLELLKCLKENKSVSLRKSAILKTLEEEYSNLSIYDIYLREKYSIKENDVTKETLLNAQKDSLYSEIKNKTRHKKLYDVINNEHISIEDSSAWLKYGNNKAKDEARLCYLQDRNLFGEKIGKCPHCKEKFKTVDHLATQCERMLYHDYMRRHNEVVRCIHMFLCNKYLIARRNKVRTHSVQETVSNDQVTINVDTRAHTNIKIQADKPDILVIDKKRKEITIIEVGITSQNQLKTVETEKKRKYDVLASHLGQIHKMKTRVIPWVMTWDGIVTKLHKHYVREIGINNSIEAYMQTIVIKKTLESISHDYRRGEEFDIVEVENKRSENPISEPDVKGDSSSDRTK